MNRLALAVRSSSSFQRRTAGLAMLGLVLAALALAQPFNNYQASIYTWIGVEVVVLLGFNLLFGTTGQMAFSHIFFVALGAYVSAILMLKANQTLVVGGVLAVLAGCAVSAVFGFLLLRLRAFYLAVASLILPLFIPALATVGGSLTGGLSGLSGVPIPFDSHSIYLGIVAVIAVVSYWFTSNLLAGAIGRAWASIREDETAAQALGIDVYRQKISAYVLSSGMATLGGVLYGPIFGFISPTSFGLNTMLPIVMASVVGGMTWAIGAVVGSFVLVYLPELLDPFVDIAPLIYAVLLLAALRFMPDGIVGGVRHVFARVRPAIRRRTGGLPLLKERVEQVATIGPEPVALARARTSSSQVSLSVKDVDLHYGGLHVLQSVSIDLCPGTVRGLIGPNGAGKTTLFNVISGFALPDKGSIRLGDVDLLGLRPSARAHRGIARTFQAAHIFEEMTVLENVLVGMHVHLRPRLLPLAIQLPAVRRKETAARNRARQLLAWVGLGDLADQLAKGLPFGSLKRLEIARALAVEPDFLLLDEPAGGLHPTEVATLEHIIASISASGIGILLVEHNVPFVMRVCEKIMVLDHGRVIAEGTAVEIARSPEVIEAYLGQPHSVAV
jgi:ABC-type branched-subunit amino acid transport system ATPase component/ABC-type branched-subunit amino acid transport system permease subunit